MLVANPRVTVAIPRLHQRGCGLSNRRGTQITARGGVCPNPRSPWQDFDSLDAVGSESTRHRGDSDFRLPRKQNFVRIHAASRGDLLMISDSLEVGLAYRGSRRHRNVVGLPRSG
ncbi:hypothetical protein H0E87_031514 [Populus deltoides]|uniref:Uncharacterized protein n=1 Tax=Populus deltoides TaxID=3696 RepID=A0A8T2WIY4_POPDE|nr:hypothetical protein H0E87_031514 [Populus deltoides]